VINLVLVDTSIWICFFACKGFDNIKKEVFTLLDEDRVAIAGPILIELLQGTRTEKEKETINNCIKALHWLEVRNEHWYRAADIAFNLRRKGITTSAIDTLIATLSIEYDCYLMHDDSDFNLLAKHSSLKCYQ
jgi:predicted nucleic acid-binding protein